jgi:antitoxin YqcF
VIGQGWPLRRGAVHTDVLDLYRLSRTLRHLLFVLPSQWDGAPEPITAGGRDVAWLMALPIAETEREYAARYGAAALEDLLAGAAIDLRDLDRPSAATGLGGFAVAG